MAVLSSVRSRLAIAARWLAPSAACACAGALAGGAAEAWIDGVAKGSPLAAVAATGFLGLVAVPVLFVASAVVRGLYAQWQPRELAASLVDEHEHGGSPRLAGWAAFLYLAAVGLAWVMFQGTWLLASWTAFKPLTLGYAQPVLAVGAGLTLVALSRPMVRLFAAIARAIDRRWRRRGGPKRRSLLRPGPILVGTVVLGLATAYAAWRFIVRRKLGPLDTSIAYAPALALAATIAAHAVWNALRPRRRRIAGAVTAALAAASIGTAVVAVRAEPSLTLEIWGDQPIAGLAIEKLFDLDTIRSSISLEEFRPVDRPGAPHPDIILVTIDTVRADRTPPYGGPADMPVLRELAQRGTVFDRAYAPSNVTRRSIPSMILGLHPNRVRGRVVGWALRIDPRHVVLAERLRAGGYETAGFMCCGGFWGPEARTGLSRGLETVEIEHDGMRLSKRARAWLDERERRTDRKPLFLWIHILEPHNWPSGGGDIRDETEKRKMYDRTLARADAMLLVLFGAFSERPPAAAPIFVVTADHGEGLGEHGAPFHSTDLYNSSIHVPFVVAGPGIQPQRVTEAVSLTDLMPTLLDLAGFQPPPVGRAMDGRSVADLAQARRPSDPDGGVAFAAMIKDRSNPGGVTAVVRGGWKLIDNGVSLELYDLRTDFGERSNVVSKHPDIADQLNALLRERRALGSAFD